MVTASHNDNGWTGVKMGANRPLTFGPDEMTRLKEIVLGAKFKPQRAAAPTHSSRISRRAISPTSPKRPKLKRKHQGGLRLRQRHRRRLRADRAGSDRLRGDPARLPSSTTPSRNTIRTPKTWRCCTRCATRCCKHKADVGLGFDGDGDRCGVVDNDRRGDFRRQGRRHAGARYVERCIRARPSWST